MSEQEFLEKIHSILGFTPKDKVIESLRHDNVWMILIQASEIRTNVEINTRFASLRAEISSYEKANASLIMDPALAEGKVRIKSKIISDTLELAKVITQYTEKQAAESKQRRMAHQQRYEKMQEDMRQRRKDRAEKEQFKKSYGQTKWSIGFTVVLGLAALVQNYYLNEKNKEIDALKDKVKQLEAQVTSPMVPTPKIKGPTIGPAKSQIKPSTISDK